MNKRYKGKAAMPLIIGIGVTIFLGPVIGPELAFLVGMSLGQMLFPTENETDMPTVSNFPIQRSDKGTPIQVVYGTRKIAGNIIWLGPLTPYTVEHSSGGKGGGGSATTTETRYKRSFLICLCHGPAETLKAWASKEEISINSYTLFDGSDNGSGINVLTGEDYSYYKGMCCVFFNQYDLGNGGQFPNFTFEVASGKELSI